jgi:hypothetical protein
VAAKTKRRKPPAHLPEPRGRRGHPVLDEIPGLREWFESEMVTNPGATIDALTERLKETGFWKLLQELGHRNGISRGTLCSERIKFEQKKARREIRLFLASAYNAGEIDLLEIDTAISGMITIELQAELEKIFESGDGFSDKALELASAFRSQVVAHSGLERAKTYVNRGAKRAEGKILAHVLEVLKGADAKSRQMVLDAIRDGAKEAQKG